MSAQKSASLLGVPYQLLQECQRRRAHHYLACLTNYFKSVSAEERIAAWRALPTTSRVSAQKSASLLGVPYQLLQECQRRRAHRCLACLTNYFKSVSAEERITTWRALPTTSRVSAQKSASLLGVPYQLLQECKRRRAHHYLARLTNYFKSVSAEERITASSRPGGLGLGLDD